MRRFEQEARHSRQKVIFKALTAWLNVYVSPEDYERLPCEFRERIEARIARTICHKPYAEMVRILRTNPVAERIIQHSERKARKRARRTK